MAAHTESTTTKRNLYRARSAHIISGKSLKDILVRANKLKHMLQRSIAHKINVEILEENIKKDLRASPATYVRNQ